MSRDVLWLKFGRGTSGQTRQTLAAFITELKTMPPGSVLLLADLTDAVLFAPVALEWQQAQELIDERCKRIAAIGLHGVIATAAHIFLQVARASGHLPPGKVRFFEDAQAAREWLVGDMG